MGWLLSVITASRLVRTALPYAVITLTIILFLLNFRRSGERAGRLAERLKSTERTHAIQRQMLEAAARRPPNRDALADRLRDGWF
ncbi:MAG: hypothetical protein Q8O82_07225 [Pseudorhodobacter sp.]|nr:hypothetical protein [Pseudorhodobacter sp.]